MNAPLQKTPIHAEHVKLGARLVPFAGYEMPVQYTGIVDEHSAVRTAAGVFDVSHMGRLRLLGEHALAVVDYLVTNDVKKLADGQAHFAKAAENHCEFKDDSDATALLALQGPKTFDVLEALGASELRALKSYHW